MPTSLDGVKVFLDAKILYGPGKAANAGGVATSGLEMTQNSMRLSWTREEVDNRLRMIMHSIHSSCVQTAERFGTPGNYVNGANIGWIPQGCGCHDGSGSRLRRLLQKPQVQMERRVVARLSMIFL